MKPIPLMKTGSIIFKSVIGHKLGFVTIDDTH